MALGMVFDYAKVAVVAEQRRSAFLALGRSLGFVATRPLACVGLYLCLFAVSVLVLSLYVVVAPGPNQGTVLTIVLTFLVSQVYIVARITTRLWFLASQMNLFRSSEDGASFINKLPRNAAGKIGRSALAVQPSSDRTSP